MQAIAKWKRIMRGVNTFQIILCVILFHSLASILIIYIHLMWFFTEEKIGRKPDENVVLTESLIVWNRRSLHNVLSNRIISNNEISIVGWWMDHARWDVDIRCFNQRLALCTKGFSSSCKADGIRAIYQYVAFSKSSNVNGFELSVTATADQLESQTIGATFGALAIVKLGDGQQENVQIQFPSNVEPLTTQSVNFKASGKSSIISIIVMLMCYGYTGSVHFANPILVPRVTHKRFHKIVSKCPTDLSAVKFPVGYIKQEKIFKPNNKSTKEQHNLVTAVTQVSMDRLLILERSLRSWDGPVSLVIYVAAKHSEKVEYEWQRLYIQKKLKNLNLSSLSHVTLAFGHSFNGDYPINILRNIAIRQASTKYIFLLDADFQPCPDFQQRFIAVLKQYVHTAKTAYVIPAFEYIELPQKSDNAPQSKEELLQLLHREEPFILPFRMSESTESHRITDYWRWYRIDKPYTLNMFSDKYEPYVILQKSNYLPMYDERFMGYGMNKVTHITKLFAANYTFAVLPDMWVIHLPHKISSYAVEFLQNAHQRLENRLERFEYIADIMRTYKLEECKHNP